MRHLRRDEGASGRLRPVLPGELGAAGRPGRLQRVSRNGLCGRVPGLLLQDARGRGAGAVLGGAARLCGAARAPQTARAASAAAQSHARRGQETLSQGCRASGAQRLLCRHFLRRSAAVCWWQTLHASVKISFLSVKIEAHFFIYIMRLFFYIIVQTFKRNKLRTNQE